jgi:hypothetical protein
MSTKHLEVIALRRVPVASLGGLFGMCLVMCDDTPNESAGFCNCPAIQTKIEGK